MGIRLSGRSVIVGLAVLAFSGQAVAAEIDMRAIAHIESSNNPMAIGSSGEIGLCQLMPGVLKDYNRTHGTKFKGFGGNADPVLQLWDGERSEMG